MFTCKKDPWYSRHYLCIWLLLCHVAHCVAVFYQLSTWCSELLKCRAHCALCNCISTIRMASWFQCLLANMALRIEGIMYLVTTLPCCTLCSHISTTRYMMYRVHDVPSCWNAATHCVHDVPCCWTTATHCATCVEPFEFCSSVLVLGYVHTCFPSNCNAVLPFHNHPIGLSSASLQGRNETSSSPTLFLYCFRATIS